jgi:hypothetical protein
MWRVLMKSNPLPSLDTAIAELRNVPTEGLVIIAAGVNKLAKTRAAGDWFTRLNYLWKDAALSILLTACPECSVVFNSVRPDGGLAMTISISSRRMDVHCYPWHLSAEAQKVARRCSQGLPVASPLLAGQLAALLAA